jgi:hypothetical protein
MRIPLKNTEVMLAVWIVFDLEILKVLHARDDFSDVRIAETSNPYCDQHIATVEVRPEFVVKLANAISSCCNSRLRSWHARPAATDHNYVLPCRAIDARQVLGLIDRQLRD